MAGVTASQVAFDTEINPEWTLTFATATTERVLTEPMPALCSEHGLPAIETRSCAVNSNGPLSERPSLRAFLRTMRAMRLFPRRDPVLARVRFECPACEFCLREVRRFRRIALLALLAVPLTIAAVLTAKSLELEKLYVPLAFAIVPSHSASGAQ